MSLRFQGSVERVKKWKRQPIRQITPSPLLSVVVTGGGLPLQRPSLHKISQFNWVFILPINHHSTFHAEQWCCWQRHGGAIFHHHHHHHHHHLPPCPNYALSSLIESLWKEKGGRYLLLLLPNPTTLSHHCCGFALLTNWLLIAVSFALSLSLAFGCSTQFSMQKLS